VKRRRILRRVLFGLLALVVIAAAGMAWVIGPSNIVGMLRYDTRREGDFKVGDRAPDVALTKLDGGGQQRMSALIGDRPLVLIFGSFT
jgi:hypothetical protein